MLNVLKKKITFIADVFEELRTPADKYSLLNRGILTQSIYMQLY